MFESMVYEVNKGYNNKYKYVLKDNKIFYYELDDKFKMRKISEDKNENKPIDLYGELIDYFKKNKPTSFEYNFDEKEYKIHFYYSKLIRNGEKIKTTTFNCKFFKKKDYDKSKKEIEKITKKLVKNKI